MKASRTSAATNNNERGRFRSPWMPWEDVLLSYLVAICGAGNWHEIASFIPERTANSCRTRWVNQLNPGVNKSPFSKEEKKRVLLLHYQYGNKWSSFVRFFHGRTDNQLKNQYHLMVKKFERALIRSAKTKSYRYCGYIQNVAVGSQFSSRSSLGKKISGSSPQFATRTELPLLCDSPSSVNAQDCCSNFSDSVNRGKINGHKTISHGDPMVADTNCEATSKLRLVPQPHQGGAREPKFIDFLGVGTPQEPKFIDFLGVGTPQEPKLIDFLGSWTAE